MGVLMLATQGASAEEQNEPPDFDVDAEVQLAMNYYGNFLANPIAWSDGQLKSLEGLLTEYGMTDQATVVMDGRIGLYGETQAPREPLPDIQFIPGNLIDEIADRIEQEVNA